MMPGLLIYIGGVVVGLFSADAPPPMRVVLALLWPVAPVAFVLTMALLLVAAAIAFPWLGIGAVGLGAAAWWCLAYSCACSV